MLTFEPLKLFAKFLVSLPRRLMHLIPSRFFARGIVINKSEVVSEWIFSSAERADLAVSLKLFAAEAQQSKLVHEATESIMYSDDLEAFSEQESLILSLLARMVNSHKSFIREAMLGYWQEAETILRTLTEVALMLHEACDSPTFVKTYQDTQSKLTKQLAKFYKTDLVAFDLSSDVIGDSELIEIERLQSSFIDLKELARKHDLTFSYLVGYLMGHNATHAKPQSSDLFVRRSGAGDLQITTKPYPTSPRLLLIIAISTVAAAALKTAVHFKIHSAATQLIELETPFKKYLESLDRNESGF